MSTNVNLLERARRVILQHKQTHFINSISEQGQLQDPSKGHFRPSLHIQRYQFVRSLLFRQCPPVRSVADFGSGHGFFVSYLKTLPFLETIFTVDQDLSSVEQTSRNMSQPQCHERLFGRTGCPLQIFNFHGNVCSPDQRLMNVRAITCIELIEHLTLDQLQQFERTVFFHYRPSMVVITTPNAEFNVIFKNLAVHAVRHCDHQFEWTRSQFHVWCESISQRYGYRFKIAGVGSSSSNVDVGFATQIAEFHLINETSCMATKMYEKMEFQLIGQHSYEQHKSLSNCQLDKIDWNSFE